MTNKIFDILRYLSEVFFPALVTFLGVVFVYIHVENPEAILAVIGAFGIFLGALVNYKRNQYNKRSED